MVLTCHVQTKMRKIFVMPLGSETTTYKLINKPTSLKGLSHRCIDFKKNYPSSIHVSLRPRMLES